LNERSNRHGNKNKKDSACKENHSDKKESCYKGQQVRLSRMWTGCFCGYSLWLYRGLRHHMLQRTDETKKIKSSYCHPEFISG